MDHRVADREEEARRQLGRPAAVRDDFLVLLGSGPALVPVFETLDHCGLWTELLPEWAPVSELPDLVADPARRAQLASAVEQGEPGWQSSVKGVGWDRIVIESTSDEQCNGRSIADIAAERGEEPVDTTIALSGTLSGAHQASAVSRSNAAGSSMASRSNPRSQDAATESV